MIRMKPHAATTMAALVATGLLAGCAVPASQTTVTPIAAPALGLTDSRPTAIAADWWRGFGDPQLDRLVADAVAGNPSLDAALAIYRRDFRPSARLAKPHAMAGFNVFAADTDAEAELLASSQQQSFVALRTGNPRQLPPPVAGYRESLGAQGNQILGHVLQCSAVGSPATVARGIAAFVDRTGVDEVMVTSAIYDHEARKRSLSITADVMQDMKIAA